MTSPLENLCGPDKPLRKEDFDAVEYADLKHSGHVRLADAKNASNSLEGCFDLQLRSRWRNWQVDEGLIVNSKLKWFERTRD